MMDPFYEYYDSSYSMENWRMDWVALLVEPMPELFSDLTKFHSEAKDWGFFNGALASPDKCVNGKLKICETKTPGVGGIGTQGQTNTVQLNRLCKDNDGFQINKRNCLTSFDELIDKGSERFKNLVVDRSSGKLQYNLDFLQIDIEGHDYEVLKMIDWDVLKPQCIQFEHVHLNKVHQAEAVKLLRSKGYSSVRRSLDVLSCLVHPKYDAKGIYVKN